MKADTLAFYSKTHFPVHPSHFSTTFDEMQELPLSRENAEQMLRYLNERVPSTHSESFELFVYQMYKLVLHLYLGQTAEVVDCLREINRQEEESEDTEWVEGENAHGVLHWAATGEVDEAILDLATYPNPLILLLFKAQGIPLPEPQSTSSFSSELDKALYARRYEEAIDLLDQDLQNGTVELSERDYALQTRGFCKAMLGDYEGALKDYNTAIQSGHNTNLFETPLLRGIVHFLNGDIEKAQKDLWPPFGNELTVRDLFLSFMGTERGFAGFFIKEILGL